MKYFFASLYVFVFLIPVLMLTSCDESPHPEEIEATVSTEGGRFSVEVVQTFHDSSSYSGYRKIFLIKDTKSGSEYIGITGIGVSEVGGHQSGKTHHTDER